MSSSARPAVIPWLVSTSATLELAGCGNRRLTDVSEMDAYELAGGNRAPIARNREPRGLITHSQTGLHGAHFVMAISAPQAGADVLQQYEEVIGIGE
jgi:hypothetical protein